MDLLASVGVAAQASVPSGLGDVTNDGKVDLVVRRRSNGTMTLYPGNGAIGTVTWGAPSLL
ncbi:hypothetical protein [Micromonospora sp. NPDC005174]|uniref:hypothetical protein n=1 Tax=unclassified Micromonospora TaxID=2617518 RepID=UPI0033B25F4D